MYLIWILGLRPGFLCFCPDLLSRFCQRTTSGFIYCLVPLFAFSSNSLVDVLVVFLRVIPHSSDRMSFSMELVQMLVLRLVVRS